MTMQEYFAVLLAGREINKERTPGGFIPFSEEEEAKLNRLRAKVIPTLKEKPEWQENK